MRKCTYCRKLYLGFASDKNFKFCNECFNLWSNATGDEKNRMEMIMNGNDNNS